MPLGWILLSAVVVRTAVVVRIKSAGDHALVRIVPRKHEIALVGRVRNRRPKREIPSQDKPPCLSAVNGRRADVIAVEFPVRHFTGARVDKPDVRPGEENLIVALSERRGCVRHLAEARCTQLAVLVSKGQTALKRVQVRRKRHPSLLADGEVEFAADRSGEVSLLDRSVIFIRENIDRSPGLVRDGAAAREAAHLPRRAVRRDDLRPFGDGDPLVAVVRAFIGRRQPQDAAGDEDVHIVVVSRVALRPHPFLVGREPQLAIAAFLEKASKRFIVMDRTRKRGGFASRHVNREHRVTDDDARNRTEEVHRLRVTSADHDLRHHLRYVYHIRLRAGGCARRRVVERRVLPVGGLRRRLDEQVIPGRRRKRDARKRTCRQHGDAHKQGTIFFCHGFSPFVKCSDSSS